MIRGNLLYMPLHRTICSNDWLNKDNVTNFQFVCVFVQTNQIFHRYDQSRSNVTILEPRFILFTLVATWYCCVWKGFAGKKTLNLWKFATSFSILWEKFMEILGIPAFPAYPSCSRSLIRYLQLQSWKNDEVWQKPYTGWKEVRKILES